MAPSGKVLSEEEQGKAVAAFEELGVCTQLAEAAAALGWKTPSAIQQQAVPLVLQGAWQGGTNETTGWLDARTRCRRPAVLGSGGALRAPRPRHRAPLPPLHAGKDVIGLAQTGSGKTGAFALPILQVGAAAAGNCRLYGPPLCSISTLSPRLGSTHPLPSMHDPPSLQVLQHLLDKPQALFALVLSPTRELAIQISEQFEALGAGIGVKCAVLVGGIDMMAQVSWGGREGGLEGGGCSEVVWGSLGEACVLERGRMVASQRTACLPASSAPLRPRHASPPHPRARP